MSGGNLSSVGTIASGAITSTGDSSMEQLTVDSIVLNDKVITMTGDTNDTATFTAGTNGTLAITTTDATGAAANITITADGTSELAGTTVTLNSGADIDLNADSGIVSLKDDATTFGSLNNNSGNLIIKSGTTTAATFSGANVTLAGTVDSGAITSTGAITAGTSFVIGSADINESDLEKIDGITDGTAAASKAVVLDANKKVTGITHIEATSGTLTNLKVSTFNASTLTDGTAIIKNGIISDSVASITAGSFITDVGSVSAKYGSFSVLYSGDMNVTNDLVVLGDTTFLNTEQVFVEDNLITLNGTEGRNISSYGGTGNVELTTDAFNNWTNYSTGQNIAIVYSTGAKKYTTVSSINTNVLTVAATDASLVPKYVAKTVTNATADGSGFEVLASGASNADNTKQFVWNQGSSAFDLKSANAQVTYAIIK